MLKSAVTSINRLGTLRKNKGRLEGSAKSGSGRFVLHVILLICMGSLASLAPAEELQIARTRVAYATKSGGHQCVSSMGIAFNPSIIQANGCSLNTQTYTWGGRRVGLLDFDLSTIPEGAEIEDAFVRLEGVCCYGNTEWFELIMMPGIGSFNLTVANQVYDAQGDIVPHPPTIPEPGHGDYPVDLDLMDDVRAGSNWLLIGIDLFGSFTNFSTTPVLHVSYSTGPPCDGDLNDDDVVDGGDISLVLGYWGSAVEAFDLDGNGSVDGADLAIVLGDWGDCPEGE
jgi:hypothetical protein